MPSSIGFPSSSTTPINAIWFQICFVISFPDLSYCAIRGVGALSLCEAMLECAQIAYLNLANCHLGATGMEPIARTIVAQHQRITTLDLSGNSIGFKGAEHLSAALRRNRQAQIRLSFHFQ